MTQQFELDWRPTLQGSVQNPALLVSIPVQTAESALLTSLAFFSIHLSYERFVGFSLCFAKYWFNCFSSHLKKVRSKEQAVCGAIGYH